MKVKVSFIFKSNTRLNRYSLQNQLFIITLVTGRLAIGWVRRVSRLVVAIFLRSNFIF